MKALGKLFLFLPLFAFLLFSCSKSGDPADELVKEGDFKISELAGNWEATYANFNDGAQQRVDVVGEGGTVSISVQSSGRFTLTIDPADRAAYTLRGEMSWELFEGDYYFAIEWDDYPGDWDTYGATLTATTFTISGGFDSAEYDFDNDGTFEACSLGMGFVRV
ncbi:MAG: hypothetical protein KJN85_07480 [Maribacter sp.]|nr:hypothetical protein [Maribacter sp.]MBT8314199.1 hypothetical protein [Maribacter sp.]